MEKKTKKISSLSLPEIKQALIRNGKGSRYHSHCLESLKRRASFQSLTSEGKDAAKLLSEYVAQDSERSGGEVSPSW